METKATTQVIPSAAEIDRLVNIGGALAAPRVHPDGALIVLVPNGFTAQTLRDEDKEPKVTRRKPTFHEIDSFIDYVQTFKIDHQSRIFLDKANLKAEAVIDYDAVGEADRGAHRAFLQLSLSPEWKIWTAAAAQTKREGLTQEEFAEFLEENAKDVEDPSAASLIELVTNLQIHRQVSFKRAINLKDGQQQFSYINEDRGGGTMTFPHHLMIAIPVFAGGAAYKTKIFMRYRLGDAGRLRFALIIHRADEIMRDAILQDLKVMGERTGLPAHLGVTG